MEDPRKLEQRVRQLEEEVAVLRGRGYGARPFFRKRASWGIGDLPFYDVALGPDPSRGEWRGHARGIIAIGDMATGVLAVGGLSRGVVAIGGLAAGFVGLGGLSIGILCAAGGLAIGSFALGGGAIGGVAIGGGAAGYYACGAGAAGQYVMDVKRQDPEALEFFATYKLCVPPRTR
jgi:hypothetical protein